MNPNDPRVAAVREEIERRLMAGEPITNLGSDRGGDVPLTQKRIYLWARERGLPYNRPVRPGGPKHMKILAALGQGYSRDEVCAMFSLAPCVLETLVDHRG